MHKLRSIMLSVGVMLLLHLFVYIAKAHYSNTPGMHTHALPTRESSSSEDTATAWLARQGKCSKWIQGRRPMTSQEQSIVSRGLWKRSHNTSNAQAPEDGIDSSWCPALLWTYTGTGNTMTRMLIEASSGWYTGSAYTDLSLVDIMPGEYMCTEGVLAVKAHPQWHSFTSLGPDGLRPDIPAVPPDAKDLCPCSFNRAVAVIRDPYATFLAEYKRLRTHDYSSCSPGLSDGHSCTGGHVSVIRKADFNATDFRVEVLRMAAEWTAMFDSYDAFAAAHPAGFYLTTFESLTQPGTRLQALADLLHALGVPPHAAGSTATQGPSCSLPTDVDTSTGIKLEPTDASLQMLGADAARTCTSDVSVSSSNELRPAASTAWGYDEARLQCAFDLARHPSIYRSKDPKGIDAQVYLEDRQLVCDVWGVVGGRAAAHGYSPYGGGTHC